MGNIWLLWVLPCVPPASETPPNISTLKLSVCLAHFLLLNDEWKLHVVENVIPSYPRDFGTLSVTSTPAPGHAYSLYSRASETSSPSKRSSASCGLIAWHCLSWAAFVSLCVSRLHLIANWLTSIQGIATHPSFSMASYQAGVSRPQSYTSRLIFIPHAKSILP